MQEPSQASRALLLCRPVLQVKERHGAQATAADDPGLGQVADIFAGHKLLCC